MSDAVWNPEDGPPAPFEALATGRYRLRLDGPAVMELRMLVNNEIAPARVVEMVRLESQEAYVVLGRWGTFRFDVRLSADLVRETMKNGGIRQLAHVVTALAHDSVESGLQALVLEEYQSCASALDERLRDVEQLSAETAALARELANREPWYRRAWRGLLEWIREP